MKRPLAALATATLAVTTLAACADDDDSDGMQTVTVGVIPIVDVAPIFLGEEQGFFADQGIELDTTFADGGAAVVPGVAANEFDFGFSNVTSLLIAQGAGLEMKMVSNGVASTGEPDNDFGAVMVNEGSSIEDASDLEGMTVSVNTQNNIGDTTIRESIRQAGGDPSDVEFTEIAFPDAPAQLEAGNVDAAWVVEPFKSIIEDDGGRAIADNYVDAADDLTVAVYFAAEHMIESDPDLVDSFVTAMDQSLEYAEENPDDVRDVIGDYTDISEELREDMILPSWPTEINAESIQALADLGEADDIFESTPDVDALLP